jgi:NAD(P)-dependent dehydrogenase (short-subunit alcohol dehydrogenase family)
VSEPRSNRKVIVGGGAGDVGVEIVAALLRDGATVVVPTRSVSKAENSFATLEHKDRVILVDGFPSDDEGVVELAAELERYGPFCGIVASLGPWFSGPTLTKLPTADWWQVLDASLGSHFFFAKSVIPHVAPGGQYIMINGAAAHAPVPRSGIVSIAAAAQLMMGKVLKDEHPQLLFHTLMIESTVATRARPSPRPNWITASDVGEAVTWLLSERGRRTAGTTITLTGRS